MERSNSDHDQVMGIYARHADAYDRCRDRTLVERSWLDRFLRLLPTRASVLDLGCGSGEPIGRYLLEQGCALTGIDASEPLLRLAESRFPGQRWLLGDMRKLDLRRRFDGIIAWDSFFHLAAAAQREMFPIFADHIQDGGGLMFTSGPIAGERIGEFQGEPLYHASLDELEYRNLLEIHGFDVMEYSPDDAQCDGHTIWLARAR